MLECIHRYGDWIKDKKEQKESGALNPLSDALLSNVLSGPYQPFFQQKLEAYAHIRFAKEQCILHEDDTYQDIVSQADYVAPKNLQNISIDKIKEVQKQLSQLTMQHDEQWKTQLKQWQATLLDALTKTYGLSEDESYLFTINEPLPELLDRYTALNVEKPKVKKGGITFRNYLTFKTDLLIKSAMSRQHQTHKQTDINKELKQYKAIFETIEKEETAIIQQQKEETTQITNPIQLPDTPDNKKK